MSSFVIFLATLNIICMSIYGTVRLVKHVARMEEKRNAHIGSVLKLKGTGDLEDLVVDGSII
jgi:hypothetical protein